MTNVLVSGASGFIGRALVAHLKAEGFKVRALYRQTPCEEVLADEICIGDIEKPSTLTKALCGIEVVFHAAGHAHADEQSDQTHLHYKINFQGTKNIFLAAKTAQVKSFIFISSVKASDAESGKDETPYAQAKLAAERWLLGAANENAISHISILRPALVYGPGWKGNLASLLRAIDKGLLPQLPRVNNQRSLVSVYDVARAALLLNESHLAHGRVYTVTDGKSYSTHQLYTLMVKACGRRPSLLYIPYMAFVLAAKMGDIMQKLCKRTMPFNSSQLRKIFGSALYSSSTLEKELGFHAADQLSTLLPAIVKQYRTNAVAKEHLNWTNKEAR